MRAPLARNNVSQYEMFILQARDIHHAAFKKTLPKAFFHMPLNVSGKRIRQPQTLDRHARMKLVFCDTVAIGRKPPREAQIAITIAVSAALIKA